MTAAWIAAYKAGGYQNKVISRYIPELMTNSLLVYWDVLAVMIPSHRTFNINNGMPFGLHFQVNSDFGGRCLVYTFYYIRFKNHFNQRRMLLPKKDQYTYTWLNVVFLIYIKPWYFLWIKFFHWNWYLIRSVAKSLLL